MKALTILQPWASLIACGAKKIETRSWATKYRGPIAIHAGKNVKEFAHLCVDEPFRSALRTYRMLGGSDYGWMLRHAGSVIAIAEIVDCQRVSAHSIWPMFSVPREPYVKLENETIVSGDELKFGDYRIGRYAWLLKNVQMIPPVPAKGMQRLWKWEGEKWLK